MNITKISFATKNASEEEILHHLNVCSTLFYPVLSETVSIEEYSKKIFLNSVTFEAWVEKLLIGLVAVYFNNKEKHSAFITNVSIMKEYSGKGVASKLLDMCILYAKSNLFSTIVLEVHKSNITALNLYEKYGFNIFDTKGDTVFMKVDLLQ